jgi:hypothetical protein
MAMPCMHVVIVNVQYDTHDVIAASCRAASVAGSRRPAVLVLSILL